MADWFPQDTDEVYLGRSRAGACLPLRPLFQGDVFAGIPRVTLTYRQGWKPGDAFESEEVSGAIFPHPCTCYRGDTPEPFQTLALVRPATEVIRDRVWTLPYDGFFDLFPYPRLKDPEETLYVADFRNTFSVATEYLNGRRVAVLSEEGWTAFKVRQILTTARLPVDADAVAVRGIKHWNESLLWTEWSRTHGSPAGFNRWLKTPLPSGEFVGTMPKDLIEGRLDELLAFVAEHGTRDGDA